MTLLALALGLTGCTAGGPTTPTDLPSPSSTAPASVPADPSPSEAPNAGATCENVMTPDAYSKIDADGLEETLFTAFDPIAVRIADEGGVTCAWGKPQTDNVLSVAQVAVGADEAAWMSALAEGGYTRTDDPVAGAFSGQPDAGNGIPPVVIVADGTVTFVSSPQFAGWVTPAS
jgi:hypothetical protein